MKSAELSAQALSAALKMILFRRFRIVTSAFSLLPKAGRKESFDCAAMTVVVFAWRIISTLASESEMKRCASSCQQIKRLSSWTCRLPVAWDRNGGGHECKIEASKSWLYSDVPFDISEAWKDR